MLNIELQVPNAYTFQKSTVSEMPLLRYGYLESRWVMESVANTDGDVIVREEFAHTSAWESEGALLGRARPIVRAAEQQTWNAIDGIAQGQAQRIAMMWSNRVPGSGAPERLVVAAVQALENRGMYVREWRQVVQEGYAALNEGDTVRLIAAHTRLLNLLAEAQVEPRSPYWEYTRYKSWERFRREATFNHFCPPRCPMNDMERYHRRVHAAWVAQVVGGALGTSIEGYRGQALRETYGEIRDYLTPPSTYNDDITFELAFLIATARVGRAVSAVEIATEWATRIPFGWSAELVALENIARGIMPPDSATTNNPFSEWIGAQMRGAVCGMVAPGVVEEAARLAWIDATVSHADNGILGELFNAVMTSSAFVNGDVRSILQDAVAMLPSQSEYAEVVSFALGACRRTSDWRVAWLQCEERFERYNWVHAYPNACAEVVALWFGEGNFDETLHIVAMEGLDVDCNAAQIMTIVSLAGGVDRDDDPLLLIPHRWREPLGDGVDTYVRGIERISFRELSDLTVRAARALGTVGSV